MSGSTKKAIALGSLGIAVVFGGVAVLQLGCMLFGIYDPVVHDQMAPEKVRFHYLRLGVIILVTLVIGVAALRYVMHARN